MKRFLSAVLIALLVLTALLSACRSGEDASSAPSESPTQPAVSEPASEPYPAESIEESSEESIEDSSEESSEENSEESFEESSETVPEFDPAELFEVTAPDYTFDIHTPDQAAFLEGSLESIASLADGWHECSKPRAYPVDFTINREAAPFVSGRFNGCRALLDRDAGFTDPKVIQTYSVTDNGYRIEFTNLLLDATYYYKLQVQYGDTWYESAPYVFYTAAYAPRNLDIEGVSNVRDIGGRFIDDSHRIRQGMIFRGAAFEDAQYGTHITQRGIAAAREDLKIKTEIELRWVSVGEISSRAESLIGGDVNYYEYEFNYDTPQLLVGNYNSIAKCFVRFADETQYPIYYHCRIGTDRT
ncbi:MAG: tyrosine-protein phosphatase, partial [Clostridia bacterium]|nr:tyrosine-protein phosphatase [Clostridia bacterium]